MDQNNERDKLIDEYEKNLLKEIDQSQQIKRVCQEVIDKGKELSEKMEDHTDLTKTKLKVLTDHQKTFLKSDEKVWTSFLAAIDNDKSQPKLLDQLYSELNDQVAFPLTMIAASASTMTDSSGNVCNALFTIAANEEKVPVETISSKYFKESILENKKTVRFGLAKLSSGYLHEFNDVIRDWESKDFKDMKCLYGLRNVIFGKLFGVNCKKGEYKSKTWYENIVFENSRVNGAKKDYYYKVLYFILTEIDPSVCLPSLVTQMVDIANKLSILHERLSTVGKLREEKASNLEIDLIFQNTLSYTAAAFRIRNTIKGNSSETYR